MMPRMDARRYLQGVEDPFTRDLIARSVRFYNKIWYDL